MAEEDRDLKESGEAVSRYRHVASAGLVLVMVLLAYLPPVLGGGAFFSQDTGDINYVMLRSHVDDLKEHGFVSWCPGVGTGLYRASDPTYGLYSPRLLLYFLISGYGAQTATVIAYAFLAGIGAYLLGLVLTRSFAPALYMALAWPVAGVFAGQVTNIPYMVSAAWLPWAMAAWIGIGRAPLRIAATGFCAAMIAVEGDLFGAGIMLSVLGLVSAIAPPSGSRSREALAWAGAAAICVGLCSIIWMPALAILSESRRAGALSLNEATAYSLDPHRLANLVAPWFWGQDNDSSFWGRHLATSVTGQGLWFPTIYMGLLAPLLWIAAVGRREGRKSAVAFVLVAALFALFAFGRHTPLVPWLMEHFPQARLFRYPAKLFTWSALLMIATAAIGLGQLSSYLDKDRSRRTTALVAGLVFAALATAFLSHSADSAAIIKEKSMRPDLSFYWIKRDIIRMALFMAVVPLVVMVAGKRPGLRRAALPIILVGITAADMLSALPVFRTVPTRELNGASKTAAFIRENGPGRVIVDENLYYFLRAGPRDSLMPNWGVLDGIDYAFGKTAVLPSLLNDLNKRDLIARHGKEVMRVLAVRYILAAADPGPWWAKKLLDRGVVRELRSFPEKNLVIYEAAETHPDIFLTRSIKIEHVTRKQALETALQDAEEGGQKKVIVSGGAAPPPLAPSSLNDTDRVLAVDRPDNDQMRIEVELGSPAWLIVREYMFNESIGGWRADIDGEKVQIAYADGIGRAIYVPAGRHRVNFLFVPPGLRAGAWISTATLVILGFIMIGHQLKRRETPEG